MAEEDTSADKAFASSRRKAFPAWLRRPLGIPGKASMVEETLGDLKLNTVCHSAKCPNRGECFSAGTATFLVMGDSCTRSCGFCAVTSRTPDSLDPEEPLRVAQAARRMRLTHVVVTMVSRDDLPDGGAAHLANVIESLRRAVPAATIEVLTSDFLGNLASVRTVAGAGPDIFAHNVETVPRLYPVIRPKARYDRSLEILEYAATLSSGSMKTKSGLMLGLGETIDETLAVLRDLRSKGVSVVTIGQYLQPSARHVAPDRFVEPEVFGLLLAEAQSMGFSAVASAPFVRSSYRAGALL